MGGGPREKAGTLGRGVGPREKAAPAAEEGSSGAAGPGCTEPGGDVGDHDRGRRAEAEQEADRRVFQRGLSPLPPREKEGTGL